MLRRHSVCLSDIPSFADSLEQDPLGESYPQTSKYENPDEDTTIWTIRRSPTPTMTVTTASASASASASATPAKPFTNTNTTAAEDNEHEQQPQDTPQTTSAKKKKKNKKKKPKSRTKAKDKLDQDQEQTEEGSTVETETESLPQLAQPMSLGSPTPFIVNSASWHKVDEAKNNEDGLQKFLSSQRLYAGDCDSPSITELTPSTTTDATVRAASIHGDKPAQQEQPQEQPQQQPSNVPEQPPVPTVCPEHTRMLCQFVPGCCVHKPRHCQYCPFPMSCCCAHHSGDCCYCAFSREQAYEGGSGNKENVNPEMSAPADPKPETASQKPIIVLEPSTSASDGSLRTHTLALLEAGSFTDSRIVLESPRNSFCLTFPAHKALLARSPRLAAIFSCLDHHSSSNDSKNTGEVEIEALVGETFYMVKAFETALQNLYGLPLLNRQNLPRFTMMAMGYTGEDVHRTVKFGMSAATADFAICYAVSGAFLGLPEIMETGMKLAMEFVDWDNIEMVLYFALSVSKFIITCPGHPISLSFSAEQELVNTWIPRLRTYLFTFIATYLQHLQQKQEPFELYVSAQSKGMPDRIPEHLRKVPGSILSNPKLAEVKFGSFGSVEEQQNPNPEVVLVSAILIGLPYKLLQEAFNIMVERRVLNESQASTIVIEREARRLYALKVWGTQRMDHGGGGVGGDEEVKELGYREIVTRKNGKVLLERVWVGLK